MGETAVQHGVERLSSENFTRKSGLGCRSRVMDCTHRQERACRLIAVDWFVVYYRDFGIDDSKLGC